RIEWQSREAERAIAASGHVLLGARATVDADIGLLRGMLLLPKALKSRNNPDGRTLRDVLPPATYARWDVLRARYLGRDRGIEKRRPLFVAQELYAAAIRRAGLDEDNQVRPAVEKIARRHDVPVEIAEIKATITDPKAAVRAFAGSSLDDLACFELTLDRLDADLAQMEARANAWAIGDLDTMRRLPYTDQGAACLAAVLESTVARSQGLDALPERVRTAWLDAAEKALVAHPRSFALLPMAEILKPDGYLALLGARGYVVEAPAP
ncbi:MAG: TraB/GumN family protein, partial [Arenimonas sp.]